MEADIKVSPFEEALQALDSGRYLLAEGLLKGVPRKDSDYLPSISTLATLAYEFGHNDKAIAYLEEAVPLSEAGDNTALIGLATMYKAIGDSENNLATLQKIYEDYPDDSTAASMYAAALNDNGEYEACRKIIERLSSLFPNQASLLLAMGDVLEKLGNLEESLDYFYLAIKADKYCLSAYTKIVAFNGWREYKFDIDVLEETTGSCTLPPQEIALVHNALGTVYEHDGDYDKSFYHYSTCNSIYRSLIPNHIIMQPWTVARLKSAYTEDLLSYANVDKQSPLVFVFGMPRSGSTLIEQILINSPDVDTLGEFKGIADEIDSLGKRIGNDLTEDTFPEDCSVLGDEYLANRIGDLDSKFIIDKMPSNHNYIGLLYLLFPNAKFIYTKRSPAAVCFSNWTTIYREGHEYSYTFEEMVAQYKFHEEVMDFWISLLPNSIHVVEYEEVVNNFDKTIGSLCNYVGIDFVDPMRNFHKKKRKVETASVGQVTRPLYKLSLDRVGKFGTRLEELNRLLS